MAVDKREPVNWWVVIGGIFVAVVTGLFAGVFFTIAGTALFDEPTPAITAAMAAVGLLYFAVYRLARSRMRDFATGVIIGGCLAVLATGACGALLTNLQAH